MSSELAGELGLNAAAFHRFCAALAGRALLTEVEKQDFALTAARRGTEERRAGLRSMPRSSRSPVPIGSAVLGAVALLARRRASQGLDQASG